MRSIARRTSSSSSLPMRSGSSTSSDTRASRARHPSHRTDAPSSLTPRPRSAVDGWATGRRPRPIASALSPSAASISLSCNGGALLCRTRRPRPSRRPDRRRSVPPNGADRTSAPCPRTRAASLREIPERHRRLREDRPSCKERKRGFHFISFT